MRQYKIRIGLVVYNANYFTVTPIPVNMILLMIV